MVESYYFKYRVGVRFGYGSTFLFKVFFILKISFFNNILCLINATSILMDGKLNNYYPLDLVLLIRIIEGFIIDKLNEKNKKDTLHTIEALNSVFNLKLICTRIHIL